MKVSHRLTLSPVTRQATLLAALLYLLAGPFAVALPGAPGGTPQVGSDPSRPAPVCQPSILDSPFIPLDSWIYPAMMRLYSLDFVDSVFLGMRPWTRASVSHMLEEAGARIEDADPGPATDQATEIYDALMYELSPDMQGPCGTLRGNTRFESLYTIARPISGTPLRDSFHLGQTIINDYGRPYAAGFNSYTGASGYAGAGRFLLYARGEFQYAPSATGYSTTLAQQLSAIDQISYIDPATGLPYNQATIPRGPIPAVTDLRWLEAYVSVHVLNHEIAFGKQDEWLGPGLGGGMAYSNNADNVYAFRIDRIEPLRIPLLSRLTGPFRYDFMVGPLQGHVVPNAPWMHLEKISFRPTENLEFGFQRTVIWGGKDHVPVTLHTFLRSFFSFSNVSPEEKQSSQDPGARFGAFDFSYRLPFVRKWLTLYSDSEVHDDVSPIDAPRRAAIRPGIYLSHVPGVPRLDVRVEAVSTDPSISNSNGGRFMYWEMIQKQGYTNKGMLFGDWIGREDKGGQGWITYHLSGNEWLQVGVRNQKAAKDFIPGGTTLNDLSFQAVKRIGKDIEVDGSFTLEHWKAPIYQPGEHTVTTTNIRVTWYPKSKTSF